MYCTAAIEILFNFKNLPLKNRQWNFIFKLEHGVFYLFIEAHKYATERYERLLVQQSNHATTP